MKILLDTLFGAGQTDTKRQDPEHALQLSCATLLVEISNADFEQQAVELERMRELLARQFSLAQDELDSLLQQAQEKSEQLVSLQHITSLLNQQFEQSMKTRLVEMMWEVVYADGDKHHYEEHLLRQIADLLYVSHADFIQARHKAEAALESRA